MVETVMLVMITVYVLLRLIVEIRGAITGHSRCTSCRSKMVLYRGKYADVCRKCGRAWGTK